jgi:hypothetical protein
LECLAGPPRRTPTSIPSSSRTRVDGDLHRARRLVVLRVEELVVLDRHPPDRTVAVDPHRPQVGAAGPPEAVEARGRLRVRLAHRVHQVRAGTGIGEHVGDEVALGDLQALLVALPELALGVDRRAPRQHAGLPVGRRVDELGNPQRALEPVGQLLVEVKRRRRWSHGPPSMGRAAPA